MILVCLGVSLIPGYNLCQYPLNFGIVPSVTSAILENRFQFQWNLCVLFRSSFISFLRINWLWTAKYCEILQCRLNSEANNQVVQLKIFGMFGLVKNKPFNEKKMIFFLSSSVSTCSLSQDCWTVVSCRCKASAIFVLPLRTICDIQTILRRAYTASAKLDSVRRGNNTSVDFLGLSELTNQFSLELFLRNMFPRHDKRDTFDDFVLLSDWTTKIGKFSVASSSNYQQIVTMKIGSSMLV